MTPMSMNDATSPSSSADRARRYRVRRAEGRHVARVEVGPEEIEALVDNSLLDPGDVADRAAITESIEVLLYVLRENAIEIDWDRWN